jgi:hypothetical protein
MNAEQAKTLTCEDFHRRAAALRAETRMLIDGSLVEAQSGKRFETVNPANGEVIATVPSGGAGEVDQGPGDRAQDGARYRRRRHLGPLLRSRRHDPALGRVQAIRKRARQMLRNPVDRDPDQIGVDPSRRFE